MEPASAVIMVGRLNPPTLGHAVLVKRLRDEATRRGIRPFLFIVDGEKSGKDKGKNPLSGNQRLALARKLFPEITIDVVASAYEAVEVLDIQGYSTAAWVAGSDRASNYQKLLDHYGTTAEMVEIDREAGEADGVTATEARKAALDGDMERFRVLMPMGVDDALLADIMNMIRKETLSDGQLDRAS